MELREFDGEVMTDNGNEDKGHEKREDKEQNEQLLVGPHDVREWSTLQHLSRFSVDCTCIYTHKLIRGKGNINNISCL